MTSLEPVTKRLSSELVWALCEGDGGEEEVSYIIMIILILGNVTQAVHAVVIGVLPRFW
jgi:hypothetical protein